MKPAPFVLVAALLASLGTASAQRPSFDVASVKASAAAQRRWRVGADCSEGRCIRFVATNASLRMLMGYAWPNLRPDEIVGGPAWIESARFDVEGKPGASGVSLQQLQQMLQTFLEERFALTTHLETRQLPTYNLIVGNNVKMKRSADQTPPPLKPPPTDPPSRGSSLFKAEAEGTVASGRAVPVADLVAILQQHTDRRLFNRTNLAGLFDFDLRFTPLTAAPNQAAPSDAAFPLLFTAVQEQLGLRLESSRGPIEVLVVDSARRPADN